MFTLPLHCGRPIQSGAIQWALSAIDADPDSITHRRRMEYLFKIERVACSGRTPTDDDVALLSAALNFLDAVSPDHNLRTI